MVIVSLTGDSTATPDAIAAYAMENGFYLEGTGTAWAIMTDGAAHYGVKGTELSLDESVVKKHLEAVLKNYGKNASGRFHHRRAFYCADLRGGWKNYCA